MKFFAFALVALLGVMHAAHAEEASYARRARVLKCKKIFPVARQGNVLYKNENIHGGRGRTFLDQDHQFNGTPTLHVAGTNNKIFSCFGLFACDQPYGCRYYQAMCGDSLSNSEFIKQARRNGGKKVLVGDGRGKCFSFTAATSREGAVH